jgi:hypothetical protein
MFTLLIVFSVSSIVLLLGIVILITRPYGTVADNPPVRQKTPGRKTTARGRKTIPLLDGIVKHHSSG